MKHLNMALVWVGLGLASMALAQDSDQSSDTDDGQALCPL